MNSPSSAARDLRPGPRAARPGDRIAFGGRAGTVFTVQGSAAAPLYVVDFDSGQRSMISPGPDTRVEAVPFSELPVAAPARRRRRPDGGEAQPTARPRGLKPAANRS